MSTDLQAALEQAKRDRDAAYGSRTLSGFRLWADEEVQRCEANAALATPEPAPALGAALKRLRDVMDNDEGAAEVYEAVRDVALATYEPAPALDLLREVSWSGVEFDHPLLDHVVVQIDRDVWEKVQKAAGHAEKEQP